jgi:hypothetical protein
MRDAAPAALPGVAPFPIENHGEIFPAAEGKFLHIVYCGKDKKRTCACLKF